MMMNLFKIQFSLVIYTFIVPKQSCKHYLVHLEQSQLLKL